MGAKALNGIGGGIEEEGGEPGGGGPPEGASATAAKRMVQAVQQFVAMLQIQQVGSVCVRCAVCPRWCSQHWQHSRECAIHCFLADSQEIISHLLHLQHAFHTESAST